MKILVQSLHDPVLINTSLERAKHNLDSVKPIPTLKFLFIKEARSVWFLVLRATCGAQTPNAVPKFSFQDSSM